MNRLIQTAGVAFGLTAGWAVEPAPDFQLVDINPNSARANAQVSPRDYLLQVSGYYFGDAS